MPTNALTIEIKNEAEVIEKLNAIRDAAREATTALENLERALDRLQGENVSGPFINEVAQQAGTVIENEPTP